MNETPTFMKQCLYALRANKSLAWAVYHTAAKLYGEPLSGGEFAKIADRPKTPKTSEIYRFKSVDKWLSRFFHPVFIGYTNGLSDAELLSIWISCARGDTGAFHKPLFVKQRRRFEAEQYRVSIRARDKRHDWNTIK